MDRVYALDPQNTNVPFAVGNLEKIDKINYVHTIDWGINHCVFLDRKDRMFSLGYNRQGKTGLGMTIINETQQEKRRRMEDQS